MVGNYPQLDRSWNHLKMNFCVSLEDNSPALLSEMGRTMKWLGSDVLGWGYCDM